MACTTLIVTKGASKDGSVMVTYSADSHQLYGELYFWPAATWAEGTMLKIYRVGQRQVYGGNTTGSGYLFCNR
ncbi:MAG: C69 family dipeptidase [Bacteroidales bacterium]